MVIEGDEYLSSPTDLRPKFHLYFPHIALLSGIAWDHINVFPTFKNYVEQFVKFTNLIENNGTLIWYKHDKEISKISQKLRSDVKSIKYSEHDFKVINEETFLITKNKNYLINVFGKHNMANISGAYQVCKQINISDEIFYNAIASFKGANKRLQKLGENKTTTIFLDFAHSPSKVTATIKAVKEQFPTRKIVACLELHTYSSLKKDFLPQYKGTMDMADEAIIYYNNHTIQLKRLEPILPSDIETNFGKKELKIFTNSMQLNDYLIKSDLKNKVLLLMSSGNFDGFNFQEFTKKIIDNN